MLIINSGKLKGILANRMMSLSELARASSLNAQTVRRLNEVSRSETVRKIVIDGLNMSIGEAKERGLLVEADKA